MSLIVVDCESDGEVPPLYSMVCFGAVIVEPSLNRTFYAKVRPISNRYKEDALTISGFSREEHRKFDDPAVIMPQFVEWIKAFSKGEPIFISDNPCYDWGFMNYYLHFFCGENPFGYSGRRIGDLYCGMVKDMHAKWKHLRKTPATHHPVDDAKGNAEAILAMQKMGLKL